MNLRPLLDQARQRQASAQADAATALSHEELRLKLNGQKVDQTLHQEVLPVLTEAARQIIKGGYSADVSSIKSELHSPAGQPMALTLALKLSNVPGAREMFCSLTYRGDCHSATVAVEIKAGASATEGPLPIQLLTRALIERHVEKLVRWSFQEPTDLDPS